MSDIPTSIRVRHELKRRTLRVARVERLPLGMVRVVLKGPELAGFTTLGFDDHVKVFVPSEAHDGTVARDFTPRRYDSHEGELWIDFFLHESGPAVAWAEHAAVGQVLGVAGPKQSSVISVDAIGTHLLIGDESALPAISRRLEELSSTARAIVVLEAEAEAGKPQLSSRAAVDLIEVPRLRVWPPANEVVGALRRIALPKTGCFAWIAHEFQSARAIRRFLTDERGFDRKWIKAAGYWQRGAAGSHESIADES